MRIENATALITGANRGAGRQFARRSLERGAGTVWATARRPETIDLDGVDPLGLDITDADSVSTAAQVASGVQVLIDNAGIVTLQHLVTGDPATTRAEIDRDFCETLAVTRAFAPVLGRSGGGAILTVMSVLSFRVFPGNGAYPAAKAAEWALTDSTRLQPAEQGTQVTGLHTSSADTDMMASWDIRENDPADVVRDALDGPEAGSDEVLADADTREVTAQLAAPPATLSAPSCARPTGVHLADQTPAALPCSR